MVNSVYLLIGIGIAVFSGVGMALLIIKKRKIDIKNKEFNKNKDTLKQKEIGERMDENMKRVLISVDDLLGKLPENEIENFSNTKEYEIYKNVMSKLIESEDEKGVKSREPKSEKIEDIVKLVEKGIITENEARKMLGLSEKKNEEHPKVIVNEIIQEKEENLSNDYDNNDKEKDVEKEIEQKIKNFIKGKKKNTDNKAKKKNKENSELVNVIKKPKSKKEMLNKLGSTING